MEKTERVIVLKGDATKWYEQAIFIINPKEQEKMPPDLVQEAERIIHEYNLKREAEKSTNPVILPGLASPQRGNFFSDFKVHIFMAAASVIVTAVFIFGLLR